MQPHENAPYSPAKIHPFPDRWRRSYPKFLVDPIVAKVSNELVSELFKKEDELSLKSEAPDPCHLLQSCWDGETKKGIEGILKYHEGLIALQMIQWIDKAIVQLY